ncbi:MAG: Ig-like domain-containing protein [Spirochaetaceae bacterium]|jgi:uncharacterized protein YjdB|nr:Ig-like domain-containing protein [Spirochaetaceae bacterium]
MQQNTIKNARFAACFALLMLALGVVSSCTDMSLPDGLSSALDANNGNNGTTGTGDGSAVTGIELNYGIMELRLRAGETAARTLRATVLPENAADKTVHWVSTNPDVAEAAATDAGNEGLVTAIGAGTAVVMAISGDGGKVATCVVTVTDPDAPPPDPDIIRVTGVSLNESALTLILTGTESAQLTATVAPTGAANRTVRWMSTNPAVAAVSSGGRVTAAADVGRAVIVATTDDGGKTALCTVTVRQPDIIAVTGVVVSPSPVNLTIGGTQQLTADVLPANANQQVVWESADPAIATVDASGMVTAHYIGQVLITATSVSHPNRRATCLVTAAGLGNVSGIVTTINNGSFTLTWTPPDNAPTFAGVEITVMEGADILQNVIIAPETAAFTQGSLTNGTSYTVEVRARYTGGYMSGPTIQTVVPRIRITETDLTNFVTIPTPVTGDDALPTPASSPTQFTIQLEWLSLSSPSLSDDNKFKAGVEYRPVLHLTAIGDYTFQGCTPGDFEYEGTPFSSGTIPPNGRTASFNAANAYPATATVRVSGTITGVGGSFIIGAHVKLKQNGVPVPHLEDTTIDGGFYTIPGVTAGTYTMYASINSTITESAPFDVLYFDVTQNLNLDNEITAFNLYDFAAQPVLAGTIENTSTPIDAAEYEVERVWKLHSGGTPATANFLAGIAYDAQLTLRAQDGSIFPTSIALSRFTYAATPPDQSTEGISIASLLISPDMKTAEVLVQFPATATVSISGTITHFNTDPFEGAQVQLRLIRPDPDMGEFNTVEFNSPVPTNSAGEYTIHGVTAGSYDILVSKAEYAPSRIPANHLRTIEVTTSDVTDADAVLKQAIPPAHLDLSTLFPAPVPGATPVTTPNSLGHTDFVSSTIAWRTAAGAPFTGPFGAVGYRATFTLTPADEYSMSGLASASFIYEQAVGLTAEIAPNGSSAVITVTFAASQFPTTAVYTAGEFTGRLAWIETNGQRGGEYTITLAANISIEPRFLDSSGNNGLAEVTIIIQGDASPQKHIRLLSTGSLFSVTGTAGNPITLVLGNNITLDGLSTTPITGCITDSTNNNSPLVVIGSYATVTMLSGSKIAGNTLETISNAYGGAVRVNTNGHFNLEGGEIYGNTAQSAYYNSDYTYYAYGGGIYNNGGVVTVSAGTISGNTAVCPTNNYAASGGGIYNTNGTVTITGGEIIYNAVTSSSSIISGGGIYSNSGAISMTGGTIRENTVTSSTNSAYGGGVYISGNVNVHNFNGGTISDNSVVSTNAVAGGGVYIINGQVNINGCTLNNNRAEGSYARGGALHISGYGTLTLTSGTISNNTASSRYPPGTVQNVGGGGIYAAVPFEMSGGEISGNRAAIFGASGRNGGGGVYLNDANFIMSGGEISGNHAAIFGATDGGGGVFMYNGDFSKTGNSIIYGDDNPTYENTASNGNGHAVYVNSGQSQGGQQRNSTAGSGDNLDSTVPGSGGGWE